MKRSYLTLNITLIVMFCLLAGQLYRMQILEGQNYDEQAKGNRERIITKNASRGIIYDRTGERLVANDPSYSIAITPADLPDTTTAASRAQRAKVFGTLAGLLGTRD